jgi:hypothetical protein
MIGKTVIGHIIRVGIQPEPENITNYGVMIEAKAKDDPVGFGLPRGQSMFYRFDDPRLIAIFQAISRPDFRNHDDLLGVEVEMMFEVRDQEKDRFVGLRVSGGKKTYLEGSVGRASRERKESLTAEGDNGMRGRRFHMCRGASDIREVVEALPIDELRRNELTNMTNLLLRMVLIENDGQISTQKLPAF